MLGLSVEEMHIEVMEGLQRQDAKRRDKVFSEQIDWQLNKHTDRRIKHSIKPNPNEPFKFEIDQKALADIERVITSNNSLLVERVSDTLSFARLPTDWKYIIDIRSSTIKDCEEEFTNPTEEKTYYVYEIPLKTKKQESPFYETFKLILDNKVLFDITTINNVSYKFEEMSQLYVVKNLLFEELVRKGHKFYWESYKKDYKPNTLFLISNTNLQCSITIDSDESTTITPATEKRIEYKKNIGVSLSSKPRTVKNDSLSDLLESNYGKPIPRSPIITVSNGLLWIYHTKRFLVSEISLDYIRKPRQINLALSQSCELGESTHQEICDLTVEYIKNILEDPSYETKLRDNQLRME